MRQKMVTLCDETWTMAMKKPNFSEWVRAMLLADDERRKEMDDVAFAHWKDHGTWPEWYS
tara:strand:+ start:63 stop:242 length:180 start_codon:yes stop_codon:yes gene_type:complete